MAPPAGQDRRVVSTESLTKSITYDKRDQYVPELNRFHNQPAVNRAEHRARGTSCNFLAKPSDLSEAVERCHKYVSIFLTMLEQLA